MREILLLAAIIVISGCSDPIDFVFKVPDNEKTKSDHCSFIDNPHCEDNWPKDYWPTDGQSTSGHTKY